MTRTKPKHEKEKVMKKSKVLLALFLMLTFIISPTSVTNAATNKTTKVQWESIKKVSAKKVTLKWKKVTKVNGYVIYYKKGKGKWKKLSTIKSANKTTYSKKGLNGKSKYSFKIRSYTKKGKKKKYGKYSSVISYNMKAPITPTLKEAKVKEISVNLKWSKSSDAKGYIIYRKENNGGYKLLSKIKSKKTVSYTDKKVKNDKSYTYRIKAYSGKYKSTYSNAKTVKISKKAASGKVTLGKLASDISGSKVDIEEKAIFTISVSVKNTKIGSKDLALYKDSMVVGYMHDDGKNGDAVANDNIYSLKIICKSNKEIEEKYQTVYQGKIRSNEIKLHYFTEIKEEKLKQQFELMKEVKKIDESFQVNQEVPANKINEVIQKVYNKSLEWQKNGLVIFTEKNTNSVFIEFASGISYLYIPYQKDVDAVGSDVNVNIVTCQPFKTWYENNRDEETARLDKEGTDTAATKIAGTFSNYSFQKNLDDERVSLDEIKNFSSNQVILWHGHGGYSSSKGSFVITGETLDEEKFLLDPGYYIKNLKYTQDYLSGRVICTNYNQLAIGSAFVSKYVGNMNNSFLYLAACESAQDDRLGNIFLDKGASAYIGNYKEINSKYNSKMQRDTINGLLKVKDSTGYYFTLSEALNYAKDRNGNDDGNGGFPRIIGNGNYRFSDMREGFISGLVRAAGSTEVLSGVSVDLYQNDRKVATAVTDKNGNYKMKATHGDYQVRIANTGYKYFTDNVSVVTNRTTYIENILLVEDTDSQGIASGKITDAITGNTISDVTMKFQKGWNADKGDIKGNTKTDDNGNYSITLPTGYYTVTMEKTGYTKTTMNIYVIDGTAENQNGVMNPIGSSEIYRAILTWGWNPRDLDAHLMGRLSDESTFEVYYSHRDQKDGSVKVASLDVDDTDGNGHETITISPTTDAPYGYYVYLYYGTGSLATSNAQVELYKGNKLIKVYNVPTTGDGRYWNVFTLTNGHIDDVNTISTKALKID